MALIIAHRGLTDGPDELRQNHPDQVRAALDLGFDAEIDVWLVNGEYYLGHDAPIHKVSWEWLTQSNLWIHCKNLAAFFDMKSRTMIHNFFWHDSDLIVLTSRGHVWTYFGRPETKDPASICVMPEVTYDWAEIQRMVSNNEWLGYCTDYPKKLDECLG